MSELNVLFTSAGRRVSLVRLFRQALADLSIQGKTVTADLQKSAPAHFVSDRQVIVPRVTSADYVPSLLEICSRERIALLVPLIDTELHLLAPCKDAFERLGTRLLVSSVETTKICLDKRDTAAFFKRAGVRTPAVLDIPALLADPATEYPLLLKPADGSSSVGVTRIRDRRELEFFSGYVANAIVQPLIRGREHTLDVLVDFQGRVRCVVPRLRMEVRAGEVSKGMTVKDRRLIEAGKKVVEALPGAVGCITVQCFLTETGEVEFIEINPRFGGGYPLSAAAGADFPRWILQWMRGEDPSIELNGWQDGKVMLRFDEAIFTGSENLQ